MCIYVTEIDKETFDSFEVIGVSLEPISNAFNFTRKFYASSDENRKNKNPFNIKYEKMIEFFGVPSFNDDMDYWWFMDYEEHGYAILTNEIEGSQIYKAVLSSDKPQSINEFSDNMEAFWVELFTMFESPK
jgi:hypothetical protein